MTVKDRKAKLTEAFWKLIRKWGEPKSLAEIYALVGHFPFTAKATPAAPRDGMNMVPTGEIWTFTGIADKNFYHSPNVIDPSKKKSRVNCHVKRWLLVDD